MSQNAVDDFALFGLGVWGNGKARSYRGMSGLGGWCAGRCGDDWFGMGRIGRDGGWVHERNGGGTELCLGRDDFDAVAEDVDGGRHVVMVWKCWWR